MHRPQQLHLLRQRQQQKCQTNSGYYEHTWISNATSTWNGASPIAGTPLSRATARRGQLRPDVNPDGIGQCCELLSGEHTVLSAGHDGLITTGRP